MKLIFYGGDHDYNYDIDVAMMSLVENLNPTITYIPSCSHDCHADFEDFVAQFEKYHLMNFIYLPVDVPIDKPILEEALKSDIIHLSGGNTYYFLHHLKKNGMFKHLKDFVKRGGILSGLSAGAILMTPNINTAGFPDFDKDENYDGLRDLRALGLVNFEIFPHYRNSARYDKELRAYSKKANHPVYAIPDGRGIVVNGRNLTFLGRSWAFHSGQKFEISKK